MTARVTIRNFSTVIEVPEDADLQTRLLGVLGREP